MLLLYRSNSTDKGASVGTHGDPTSVIDSTMWLIGNRMYFRAIKE